MLAGFFRFPLAGNGVRLPAGKTEPRQHANGF
jgi:hypothetical protein